MTDRPINLRDWQVRAALDDRLSVLVVPIPPSPAKWRSQYPYYRPDVRANHLWFWDGKHDRVGVSAPLPLSVGDRLWARETWCYSASGGYDAKPGYCIETGANSIWYRATESGQCEGPWRSSATMRREFSRLTLIPTSVRVCRLDGLTNAEIIGTGVEMFVPPVSGVGMTAEEAHRSVYEYSLALADDRFEADAWERNDWVAVSVVTAHQKNIDALSEGSGS